MQVTTNLSKGSDKLSNKKSNKVSEIKLTQPVANKLEVLAGQSPALVDMEIKYVDENKPTISQILRALVKIDEDEIDLGINVGYWGKQLEVKAIKFETIDEYIGKLKKLSRDLTVEQIIKIHECIRSKEKLVNELIALGDEKGLRKVKKMIVDMKETVHRLELCGTAGNPLAKHITIAKNNSKIVLNNVLYCGKALCPRCNIRRAIERAKALEAKMKSITEKGNIVLYLVTFTLRHYEGVIFKVLQQALYKAFGGMIRCSWWGKAVKGFVKQLEVTYTGGYHAHIHAIVGLDKSIDTGDFSKKVADYWEKKARKLGRSCDWSKMGDEWFKKIDKPDFGRVVNYFVNFDISGRYNIVDEIVSTHRKDKAPWSLPVEKYCEVYKQSKGIRWFSTSGIFKLDDELENENDEPSLNGSSSEKKVLLEIPIMVWKSLNLGDKFIIRDVVRKRAIRAIDDKECINRIKIIINGYLSINPSLFNEQNPVNAP